VEACRPTLPTYTVEASTDASGEVLDPRHRQASGRLRLPAVHHAACRIQRAWKVSRWRRRFVNFSECELGWVGSLDWLQHHNLLYGTELADSEDTRRWMQYRHGAPLDREVDPWGSSKLRDHLNKMWYGRTTEELQMSAEQEAMQMQRELEEREQRYSAVAAPEMVQCYSSYGAPIFGQDVLTAYYDTPHGRQSATHRSASLIAQGRSAAVLDATAPHTQSSVGIAASFRSPPRTERAVRLMGAALSSGKATSLSPRREAPMWRVKAETLGARSMRPQTVSSLVPAAAPAAVPAHSPPQTHRSTRTAATAPSQAVGLRPRSPMQAQSASRGASATAPPASSVNTVGGCGGAASALVAVATGGSPVSGRQSLPASAAAASSARPSQPAPSNGAAPVTHRSNSGVCGGAGAGAPPIGQQPAIGSSPQLALLGRQQLAAASMTAGSRRSVFV